MAFFAFLAVTMQFMGAMSDEGKQLRILIDLAHIHPMLVHFPVALLPVALSTQAITVAKGQSLFERSCSAQTGFWLTMLTAAIFGDLAPDIACGVETTNRFMSD